MGNSRVLFVDDEALMRRAFRRAVGVGALRVDLASSGFEALRMAQRTDYAVVVTDLRMPGMDGLSLIERLQPTRPDTQFVLLTAATVAELELELTRSHQHAIGAVLQKPCDTKTLLETVTKAVEVGLSPQPVKAPRVLLVEDDPADRALVTRRLRTFLGGVEPTVATSLAEAVSYLHDGAFDLILSDLSLPDAVGLEAVRRIGTAAPGAALVVLTGFEDDDVALRAVQLGAQDFIAKNSLTASRLSRSLQFALERSRAAQRLSHMAYFDQLTGLANRAMLRNRLHHAVASAQRSGSLFALAYVDLDSFKPVNDTYGHDVGDEFLQEVGCRLSAAVRPCDLVARLGGDEFALVIENLQGKDEIQRILERLRGELERTAEIAGHQLPMSASLGIAVYPNVADNPEALLRRADEAMYRAKKSPGTSWVLAGDDAAPAEALP